MTSNGSGFLHEPEGEPATEEGRRLFEEDLEELGFIMNASRLWAHQPAAFYGIIGQLRAANRVLRLSVRERGVVVTATASSFGDSYCSLAWGCKLSEASDPQTAAGVLSGEDGEDGELTVRERALAEWARKVAIDPHRTTATDVRELREVGLSESEILSATVFVALRVAFSTVNAALGAQPDAQYRELAPEAVLKAVTYGRPIAET
jgi:uncharacterized peroxidase-related enzyme